MNSQKINHRTILITNLKKFYRWLQNCCPAPQDESSCWLYASPLRRPPLLPKPCFHTSATSPDTKLSTSSFLKAQQDALSSWLTNRLPFISTLAPSTEQHPLLSFHKWSSLGSIPAGQVPLWKDVSVRPQLPGAKSSLCQLQPGSSCPAPLHLKFHCSFFLLLHQHLHRQDIWASLGPILHNPSLTTQGLPSPI